MQIIIYLTTYIIGVLLGSFFTLATYRLPLKQDITHTRSYCPKCNHRLNFLDLIPVLSYIFLRGKCRYCNEKISPRYITIELISGFIYLLFVVSLKLDVYTMNLINLIHLLLSTILISILFIISGIAKENNKLPNSLTTSGIITLILYITYLYIFKLSIHKYIIYLSLFASIVLTVFAKLLKCNKNSLTFIQCFSLIVLIIISNFIII